MPEGGVVGRATSRASFADIVAVGGIALDAAASGPGALPAAAIAVAPTPLFAAAPLLAGGLAPSGPWRMRRLG